MKVYVGQIYSQMRILIRTAIDNKVNGGPKLNTTENSVKKEASINEVTEGLKGQVIDLKA